MSYKNPTLKEIKENPEKALKIVEDNQQYIERLEEENEETVKQLIDSLVKNIDNQKEIDQRKEENRKYEEEINAKDKKIKELKAENRQISELFCEVSGLQEKNSEISDKIHQQRKSNEELKDLLDYISDLHDEELKQKFYKFLENNNTIMDGMLHALKKMILPAANRTTEIVNNSLHQLQGISLHQSPQPVLNTQLNDGTQPHIGKPLAQSTPQRFPFRNFSSPPPDPSFLNQLDQLAAKNSGLGMENLVQEEEENWASFEDEEPAVPMEIDEDGQSKGKMVPKEEKIIVNAADKQQQDKLEVKDESNSDKTVDAIQKSIDTLKEEKEEKKVEKKTEKLEEGQFHGDQTEEEAQLSQQRFHQWLEISGFLLFIFFVAFILPTFLLNLLEYNGGMASTQ